MQNIIDSQGYAKVTRFLVGLASICALLSIPGLLATIWLNYRVLHEGCTPYLKELIDATAPNVLVVSLFQLAAILSACSFFAWFHASYRNLIVMKADPRFKISWSYYSWFLPIANFIIPYLMTIEIWKGSQTSQGSRGPNVDAEGRYLIAKWWWSFVAAWTLWICGALLREDGPVGWQGIFSWICITISLVTVAYAGRCCMRMIRLITTYQSELHKEIETSST